MGFVQKTRGNKTSALTKEITYFRTPKNIS